MLFLALMDFVNVMLYDIKGSWEGSPIGNHASCEDFLIAATDWNERLPKNKIVLGTPTYGRPFADNGCLRVWGNESWSGNVISQKHIVQYFSETLRDDTTAGAF